MAKVLVTGATGFIGKRLIFELLDLGHEVFALCRMRGVSPGLIENSTLHIIWGDLKNLDTLDAFPQELDAAYYLAHSMAENPLDLQKTEAITAENFVTFLEKTNCRQILYLGAITSENQSLSPHLASRLQVEKILKKSKIPLTVLRASIIIGAGSASFEIIRDLVEKLPFMVAPKWVKSLCQPIAIEDVLFYLSHLLLEKQAFEKTFEIGGLEIMSFKELLLRYARFRKLKRYILEVPVLTPKLSSYWLVFISSVRFSLCSYLIESMKCNSICSENLIQKILPHSCLSLEDSLKRAFFYISENKVMSTWMDAWPIESDHGDLASYIKVPQEGCLKDCKKVPLMIPKKEVIQRIWSLGGDNGWDTLNWAWKIRGLIDQFMGGSGLNRGRRHPTQIEVGDSIDFWRVVKADIEEGNLILYAEMKLPGEAWLEFKIEKNELHQTATFRPRGILGRLYWYFLIPFHLFIFHKMAKNLAQKTK